MAKYRPGLHKQISAIFDGVPIPKPNGTQQAPHKARASEAGYIPPEPAAHIPSAATINRSTVPQIPQPQHPPKPVAIDTTEYSANEKTAKTTWKQTLENIKLKLFAPKPGIDRKRQVTMAVMIPVLSIILIVALSHALMTAPPPAVTKADTIEHANAIARSGYEPDWRIPEPYPTGLRDPMQIGPATAASSQTATLRVKGIVYSQDNPSAVIGDKIVRQGDKIRGVTIVKINRDSVQFQLNGKTWTQKVQK